MYVYTLCGRILACDCAHVRSGVRVRMFACAGVFARVRANACVFMRGCVCACVLGTTCARVNACLRARARMRRVHVHVRPRVGARAHESVSALMRECACICVRAYADMCMYKMNKHIKTARVVSKKQHRRQEGATCRFYIYIYISLSFLSPSSSPFSFMVSSYLCII